jgi:hypothetical protein
LIVPRLLVANFDCELHFARDGSPGPHKALPQKIRQVLSQAAPALRVFGTQDDHLWTLASLPSSESSSVSGPFAKLANYDAILAWGQSSDLPTPQTLTSEPSAETWQEQLWSLRAEPKVAAQCNDRRFCCELDIPAEWKLPEREIVTSIEALDQYIGTRALGPDDTWVAKAPWAASGRERVRRRGRRLEGEMRVRTQRLLERYGAMVIEGWMPRVDDYGVAGIIGDTLESIRVFAPHQLHSDDTGVFRGVRIADRETVAKLGAVFAGALEDTANTVAHTLFEKGYRGPFGIDAFVYEDGSGSRRLQSICEINARLCFGLVARAQAEKIGLGEFEFAF